MFHFRTFEVLPLSNNKLTDIFSYLKSDYSSLLCSLTYVKHHCCIAECKHLHPPWSFNRITYLYLIKLIPNNTTIQNMRPNQQKNSLKRGFVTTLSVFWPDLKKAEYDIWQERNVNKNVWGLRYEAAEYYNPENPKDVQIIKSVWEAVIQAKHWHTNY